MPKFVSVHVTSCMTRQDVERLVKRFMMEASEGDICCAHVQCDTIKGRMICQWEAPSEEALTEWLAQRNVRFRGSEEWVIRVQMESQDGQLVVL